MERRGDVLGRWTAGDAVLPLPVVAGPAVLEVRAETLLYPVTVARAA